MITLVKVGEEYHTQLLELIGLSSDEKPTIRFKGIHIANGSKFTEIDTGFEFKYNAAVNVWMKVSTSSGKVSLPQTSDGAVDNGMKGQFAVSNGDGSISWASIESAEEVKY